MEHTILLETLRANKIQSNRLYWNFLDKFKPLFWELIYNKLLNLNNKQYVHIIASLNCLYKLKNSTVTCSSVLNTNTRKIIHIKETNSNNKRESNPINTHINNIIDTKPKTKPKPSVEAKPKLDVKAKPKPSVEAKPKLDVKVKPKPSVEVKPKPSVEVKPKPSVETKPKPDVKVKPKSDVKVKPKPSMEVKPKPDVKVKPKPDVKVKPSKPNVETKLKPDVKVKPSKPNVETKSVVTHKKKLFTGAKAYTSASNYKEYLKHKHNIDKITNAIYAKYKEEDKYDSSIYTPTQPWFNYIPNNMIIPEHLVECN